jgi:hypothetical protein
MSERIRYENKEIGGVDYLVSCKVYDTLDGRRLRVFIKPSSLEYHVLDTVQGGRVLEGSGSSLHKVKKKAKRSLTELGVVFTPELRPGRKKAKTFVSNSDLLSSIE